MRKVRTLASICVQDLSSPFVAERRDVLRRYIDAGIEFTQLTRKRAEDVVRELVRAGEVQAEQAQQAVEELMERNRRNTERLVETVRGEIRSQVANLGLATRDDIARLQRRVDALEAGAGRAGGAKKVAPKKAATKKAAGKKAGAKKAGAKKSAAKKSAPRRP